MNLRTFAEVATIIAVVIAFLQYTDVEPNALDKIPELYKTAAEKDIESIDIEPLKEKYAGKNNPLYFQYKAAIAIPSPSSKSLALSKVIKAALSEKDFQIAVAAAKEITSPSSQSIELQKIVNAALATEDSAGFAVVAAELIPSSSSKTISLNKIVEFYGKKFSASQPPVKLTSFDKYKIIYEFSDSPRYINMSSSDAKIFTEQWFTKRNYQEFILFKEYYIFADSPAHLNMNSEKAVEFSTNWLESYTKDEFDIYRETFIFADSPSGMDMSTSEAMEFSLKKVTEFRSKPAANKQINRDM